MKTERELFLDWHFLDWKLHNAVTDTMDFARVLYDRVYSHDHTSAVRDVEFKAWCASASREGYKLVPVEINDEIESAMFSSVARGEMPCDIYKAMLEAVEK